MNAVFLVDSLFICRTYLFVLAKNEVVEGVMWFAVVRSLIFFFADIDTV